MDGEMSDRDDYAQLLNSFRIPKRAKLAVDQQEAEKDRFTPVVKESLPDGSIRQANLVEKSIQAMESVLSLDKIQYRLEDSFFNVTIIRGKMLTAVWRFEQKLAEVTIMGGKNIATIGRCMNGRTFLLPEEALFLVDRGGLRLFVDDKQLDLYEVFELIMTQSEWLHLEYYLVGNFHEF